MHSAHRIASLIGSMFVPVIVAAVVVVLVTAGDAAAQNTVDTGKSRVTELGVELGGLAGVTWLDPDDFRTKPHYGLRGILRTPYWSTFGTYFRAVPRGGALDSQGNVVPGFYWSGGLEATVELPLWSVAPYLVVAPGIGQFRGDSTPTHTYTLVGWGGGVSLGLRGGVKLRVEGRYNQYWADQPIFAGGTSRKATGREMSFGIDMPLRWREGDEDFDGVRDRDDACPETPSGVQVDARGCGLDGDRDGVLDGLDLCPNTTTGATIDRHGCPLDGDGDRVPDGLDRCPDTDLGVVVDAQGCPVDSDGDGVFDGIDICPDTQPGTTVDDDGCRLAEWQDPTAAITAALETPVSIDATKTNVADVLRLLGQQTGINVVVDSAVNGSITLHVTDIAGADALELIVAAAGMTYYWDRNAVVVTTPEKLKASGAVQSVPLPVRHVRAGDLLPTLGTLTDADNIQVSPRGQHVVVTSTPDVIAQARDLVQSMDRPLPQVAIEVRVVEIQVDRLREIGINWAAHSNSSTLVSGLFIPPPFPEDPAGVLALSKSTSSYSLDVALQALERNGQARILASPRLMTLGGKPARILIGDRVPYFTTQFNSETGAREVIVEFVEVGIRLDLLPDVQADRSITTQIRTEVSSIVSFRGPMQEIPWVKTREAETMVRVARNQWVSLGGLLSRAERQKVVSVPLLGDIPALGSLFRSTSTENVDTEVVIMVSPTLVQS